MDTAIIILPALLRLLYGTGLRISEALSLKNKDINLDDNYLIVRDSKNGKERMTPISASLSEVFKEYVKYRNLMPLVQTDDSFFITLSGKNCNRDHVSKWFRKILCSAGISRNDHGPRLHDLRYPNKNIIQTFLRKA
jgi:integrase/recombinase XerD